MKKYIKKALWIIPFVYSLNLSATKYYFIGSTTASTYGDASDIGNWSDNSTPGSGSQPPALFLTGDDYDLNGHNIDIANCFLYKMNFVNSSTSSKIKNSGVAYFLEQLPPTFSSSGITLELSNDGTIVYLYDASPVVTTIADIDYYNLDLSAPCGFEIANNSSTVTIKNKLMFDVYAATYLPTLVVKTNGTLILGANSTIEIGPQGGTLDSLACSLFVEGSLTDNRSIKSYPLTVKIVGPTDIIGSHFFHLNVSSSAKLTENAYCSYQLTIGNSTSVYVLNLNNYTLSTPRITAPKLATSSTTFNKLNVGGTSKLRLINSNAITIANTLFGANTTTNSTPYNIEIAGAARTNISTSITIDNLTITKTGINFSNTSAATTITIGSSLTLIESSGNWVTKTNAALSHKINLTSASSPFPRLIINGNGSTMTYPSGYFNNSTVDNLEINFPSGGTFTLPENLTINKTLNLNSVTGNYLSLNNRQLTLKGDIYNTNGNSGGKIIGSTTSNLICSTANASVGTIYFDQTSAASSTLQNLTLANQASCTLGSNLIIGKNGVNLGDGTSSNSNIALTIGANTLTFSGTQANPILSRTNGTINPASGTIKFAQTANQGYDLTLGAYSQNINNLTLAFANANGGILTPSGSMTINGTLDLGNDKNTLSLNGTTLTVIGSINSTGGKFRGSNTSNLFVQSNSDLYFDQTSEEYRTLKDLIIGASNVNLRNWLNITGGTSTTGFGIVDVIAASNNLYTNGYLTLKSNEYGTAMISKNPGNIAYNSSGTSADETMLVENYIGSSGRGRQYRFLSSPVNNGNFLDWRDSLRTVTISGVTSPRSGRGTHITGDYTKALETGSAIDSFDLSTTNHPSAFTYDETKAGSVTGISTTLGAKEDPGWSRLSQANDNIIVNGKGYRVLIRGDRTISLTSSGSNFTPNPTTIQTRGGYVKGPVTVSITNSGSNTNNGINLIGNPYPCAVDWDEVYKASSNVDASYVLYDPVNKRWQAYNAPAGTPSTYRYISPGQGFLVYTGNPTSSGGGSVVFPVIAKSTSDAGSRTFTEIKTNHLITHLRRDTTAADMNIIYFLGGATNYYDKYDAGHIQNEYVNLSSLDSTNTLYNINCLDSLVGQIVPLSVYGTPKGTYTMAFDDVNTFRNHDVFLVDNFLKKTTKVDDFTQYNVEITEDKFSYAEGRFYISFEPKSTASIVPLTKTENFNINPNPVKDVINISMKTSVFGDLRYEIFNINGQIISKGLLNEGENRINSTDLSKGIYFITLKTNSETQTIKFIK